MVSIGTRTDAPLPDDSEAITEEATVDGDVPLTVNDLRARPGTARSAFGARDFRRLWIATLSSNVGTWMQNVALGAFAYQLTHSASYVALIGFAQLGPLLLLAPVGGLLADVVDRRRLLVLTNLEQMVFSALLALVASSSHPSRGLLIAVVLAVGAGNALSGPPLSSLLPNLVPRGDLAGAISLQSVQMNLSRVIGPAIGGLLLPAIDASGVFAVNAVTYLFAIAGAVAIRPVRQAATATGGTGRRLLGGLAAARSDRLIGSVLLTVAAISFFCLPFIGLMPVIAARNLQLDVTGLAYGLLYACFGLGAAAGAITVGSLLVGQRRESVIAVGLVSFGALLLVFALLRSAAAAYPVVFLVGFSYFATMTSLSTRLQEHLDDAIRGRVMALYMMGFGGTVPVGLLAAGPIASATSVSAVLIGGAVIAMLLGLLVRPKPDSPEASHILAGNATLKETG
ncbi:MAG TPA: MFS transporter [Mycobacteriales bacterium]|nr:MFS transporter [Mycobacteriales bacterium]